MRLPYCLGRLRFVAMYINCVTVAVDDLWAISDQYILFIPCSHCVKISALHCTNRYIAQALWRGIVSRHGHLYQSFFGPMIVHDYCPIIYISPIPYYTRDRHVSCLFLQYTLRGSTIVLDSVIPHGLETKRCVLSLFIHVGPSSVC